MNWLKQAFFPAKKQARNEKYRSKYNVVHTRSAGENVQLRRANRTNTEVDVISNKGGTIHHAGRCVQENRNLATASSSSDKVVGQSKLVSYFIDDTQSCVTFLFLDLLHLNLFYLNPQIIVSQVEGVATLFLPIYEACIRLFFLTSALSLEGASSLLSLSPLAMVLGPSP